MSTATKQKPGPELANSRVAERIPLLRNGDRLSGEEFDRRFKAMPNLKKAELIDGRVYLPSPAYNPLQGLDRTMSSPVSFRGHAKPHFHSIGWLWLYTGSTLGTEGGDNGSIRLDLDNRPQPDAFVLIAPSYGGQARISDDDYVEGAPELIVEISHSSVSYDLHEKLDAYRRNGVQEYVVWRVEDQVMDWFALQDGQFVRLPLSPDGLYRSVVLPGLWVDPDALIRVDIPRVIEVLQQGLASPEHAAFVEQLKATAARLAAEVPAQEPLP
jgi:Uma2 family endonuclease